MKNWLTPDWSAPAHIRAYSTLRHQGVSQGAWSSWNLATHVHDSAAHVAQNRELLVSALRLPSEPVWLDQVHSDRMLLLDDTISNANLQADGSFTRQLARVCVVMTADCLPVLMTNRAGTEVAAVHAGWRGLAAGIIEKAVQCFQCPVTDVMVWLGPAIGPDAFEVGEDVRQVFMQSDPMAESAFIASGHGKYLADIYALAKQRIQAVGVNAVYGGGHCTVTEAERFYSYRRDQDTGRMASLIWIEAVPYF